MITGILTMSLLLQEVQSKLAVPDLPLLEKLALQSQVEGLQQALELKSQAAMIAYGQLMPLRIEDALYKTYGGKVVARQISIHASGAYLKLAEEAQERARGERIIVARQRAQTTARRFARIVEDRKILLTRREKTN